jgi:hypothetical protein
MKDSTKRIAIIGGGPSALFMYKRLVDADRNATVTIYERHGALGAGMPYSGFGACDEHITNVSPNEIPEIVTSVEEWVQSAPADLIRHHNISDSSFNNYKVLPRLFFGRYLSAQFDLLLKKAKSKRLITHVHLNTEVSDLIDHAEANAISVVTTSASTQCFDHVIICTGHSWPASHENSIPGYFDSPYPPSKLRLKINYPVAIRGSSLTAIDAVRTLARHNGNFIDREDGMLEYQSGKDSEGFKLVLHSIDGLLPALRFHLEDSHLQKNAVLSDEAIQKNMEENDGFLSLDYVFEKNFKEPLRQMDTQTYDRIKYFSLEEFVAEMMKLREKLDAFTLFKAEYVEAEKSIKRRESVHWKEMLAVLSFAMNYPAKHFSAEDMIRVQKVLKPLISIVIAFVPQSSAKELIALHNAGVLEMVAVRPDSYVEPGIKSGATFHYTDEKNNKHSVSYQLFVDCIGQPQLHYYQFPFKTVLNNKTITPALLKFRSKEEGEAAFKRTNQDVEKSSTGDYYLKVPGIAINDSFQVVDSYGAVNPRMFIMAVPYIGGYNPDYSGLDFCEAASARIARQLIRD